MIPRQEPRLPFHRVHLASLRGRSAPNGCDVSCVVVQRTERLAERPSPANQRTLCAPERISRVVHRARRAVFRGFAGGAPTSASDTSPFQAVQPSFHGGDTPFPPDALTLQLLMTPSTRRKGAPTRWNRTPNDAPPISRRGNRIPTSQNRASRGPFAASTNRAGSSHHCNAVLHQFTHSSHSRELI